MTALSNGQRMEKIRGSSGQDAILIQDFLEGNQTAFDKLVLKHKGRLFNLCYWFLGDYQEANDTAQEVFIKVYRSLKKFRFESAFSTWLYCIGVNTCKNRLKSSEFKRRKQTISIENPGGLNNNSSSAEIPSENNSPVDEFERKERLGLIKEAIDSLSEQQREVVTLRDIEGLSYEEIASITNLNLGTLKSRLSRARMALREKLGRVI